MTKFKSFSKLCFMVKAEDNYDDPKFKKGLDHDEDYFFISYQQGDFSLTRSEFDAYEIPNTDGNFTDLPKIEEKIINSFLRYNSRVDINSLQVIELHYSSFYETIDSYGSDFIDARKRHALKKLSEQDIKSLKLIDDELYLRMKYERIPSRLSDDDGIDYPF